MKLPPTSTPTPPNFEFETIPKVHSWRDRAPISLGDEVEFYFDRLKIKLAAEGET
jgi:hypothetical protein